MEAGGARVPPSCHVLRMSTLYSGPMEIPGYQILAPIGAGGMASTYLAEPHGGGAQVVLKVLPADEMDDRSVRRFLNEARLIASVGHPNIVRIEAVNVCAEGAWMAMEYVPGGDLAARIRAQRFTPEAALAILKPIAEALAAAHALGIVHRDVKPANILFRKDGTPLLTDFGIAKDLKAELDLTRTGVFLGSPNYMAPEQADGRAVDGRTDLYALGCIFFEMLSGRKPYAGDSVFEVVDQHQRAPIPSLPEAFWRWQPVLQKMLGKRPGDRFVDMHAFLNAVAAVHGHSGVAADMLSSQCGVADLVWRRVRQLITALLFLGVLGLGILFFMLG